MTIKEKLVLIEDIRRRNKERDKLFVAETKEDDRDV